MPCVSLNQRLVGIIVFRLFGESKLIHCQFITLSLISTFLEAFFNFVTRETNLNIPVCSNPNSNAK